MLTSQKRSNPICRIQEPVDLGETLSEFIDMLIQMKKEQQEKQEIQASL